jgi:hypothetical protein
MKKYKVWGQIGTHLFDYVIEADNFDYSQEGVYRFENSETGEMWCFPTTKTVVKTIIGK